jgi:hypothetical protein
MLFARFPHSALDVQRLEIRFETGGKVVITMRRLLYARRRRAVMA